MTYFISSKIFMGSLLLQLVVIGVTLPLVVLFLIKNNSVSKKLISEMAPAQ